MRYIIAVIKRGAMKIEVVIPSVMVLVLIASAILLALVARNKNAGFRADLIVTEANIGIPGISKMYSISIGFNR
jgi:hypothetical protein